MADSPIPSQMFLIKPMTDLQKACAARHNLTAAICFRRLCQAQVYTASVPLAVHGIHNSHET